MVLRSFPVIAIPNTLLSKMARCSQRYVCLLAAPVVNQVDVVEVEEAPAARSRRRSKLRANQLGGGQCRPLGKVCRSGAPIVAEDGPVCEELHDVVSSVMRALIVCAR